MLLAVAVMFTACEDDRDSNPTLVQPSGFTLNNPVNTLVDLAASTAIPFAWSQPDYGGWPAAVEYQLEVSPTNSWNVSTDQAAADESGEKLADYAVIPSIYSACQGNMSAIELAKALVSICQWAEDEVPEKQTVYVRARATTPGTQTVYSNVVSLDVNPYYIELADAEIELWYLVGEGIGSADWDNGAGSVATGGLIPMYPIAGNEYDSRTGQGEIQYVGYFQAGKGFKLIMTPGNWDNQWGMGDGGFVKNDGGSGNLTVDADGYYRIRLNTYKDLRALSGNTSGLGASPANDRNMWINDTAQIVSAAGLSKTEFNRVSNTEPGFWYQNTSMLNGVSTTQSFWSVNNSNVLEYLDLLAVSDVNNNSWQFTNLDSRTALNELASVKYLYCLHPEKLPYGYGKESLDPDSANSVYENQMPLPLGYTYDSVISRETFDKLTPAERQDIMLTHAVVDEPGALGDPRTADALRTDLSCAELPFTASCLDWGVNMSDSTTFAVTNPGAQVRLNFAPVAEGECYLYFDNIQFTKSTYPDLYLGGEDVDPKNQYSKEDWDALSPYERFSIRKNIFDELPLGNIKIGVQFGDGSNADANADLIDSNEINYILPDNYQFYSGRQSFMVNSYPLTKPISSITITFPEMGVYHFDGISVISEPLTGYEEAAKARAAEPLTGLDIHQNETSYTTNRVDGEIDVSGDRLLCLTIPYSEGWTAYVDGVKTPIEKVNVMFMGLRLTSGHHTITLRYETPGLRLGLLITCAGAALLILWAILSHIARRRAKAEPAGD